MVEERCWLGWMFGGLDKMILCFQKSSEGSFLNNGQRNTDCAVFHLLCSKIESHTLFACANLISSSPFTSTGDSFVLYMMF